MGAGQFPAGRFDRAGLDPVYLPVPTPPPAQIVAIKFDPQTRRFVQNANGSFVSVHPVDQRVALLLWIEQGDIPSAPTVGRRIRKRIARVDPAVIPQIAFDAVRTTLQPVIDAGDIRLGDPGAATQAVRRGVDVDTSVRGQAKIAVYYINLRLPVPTMRTLQL